MKEEKIRKYFIITSIVAFMLVIIYFVYKIWFDPKIEFLFPTLKGNWLLYPDIPIGNKVPYTPNTLYRKKFYVYKKINKYSIKIYAMRKFVLRINDAIIYNANNFPEKVNWKMPTTINIAPYTKVGENTIEIEVNNDYGPPALLVQDIENYDISISNPTNWYILKPFENNNIGYDKVYEPELIKGNIDFNQTFIGRNKEKIRWQKVTLKEQDRFLVYKGDYSENYDLVSYFATYIDSDYDIPYINFNVSSDDGIKVWINDTLYHEKNIARGVDIRNPDKFSANLKKGKNKVLIKIIQGGGPWGMAFSIETPINNNLSTDKTWLVKLKDTSDWIVPVYSDENNFYGQQIKTPIQNTYWYNYVLIIFGIYIFFILLALNKNISALWKNNEPLFNTNTFSDNTKKIIYNIFIYLIFILGAILYINNALNYDSSRTPFDYWCHIEYLEKLWQKPLPPLANEGCMTYQPPLYYYIATLIYKLISPKVVPFIGVLSSLLQSYLTLLILRKLLPNNQFAHIVGLCFSLFIPMNLYMNILISNEMFSSFMITLTIYYLIKHFFKEEIKIKHIIILGIITSLSLLSKYTAIFVFITIVVILFIRIFYKIDNKGKKKELIYLGSYLFIVIVLAGWFYIRNYVIFGNPLIMNWDESISHYEHPQGYRDFSFYLRFGASFFYTPDFTKWYSFLDGTYGSMWFDTHNSFYHIGEIPNLPVIGNYILLIAVLPTIALIFGFFKSIKSILKEKVLSHNLAFVFLTIALFLAFIEYNMVLPYWSTLKAFYMISLILPFSYFQAIGLSSMRENLGIMRIIVYFFLSILYLLIYYTFWFNL